MVAPALDKTDIRHALLYIVQAAGHVEADLVDGDDITDSVRTVLYAALVLHKAALIQDPPGFGALLNHTYSKLH